MADRTLVDRAELCYRSYWGTTVYYYSESAGTNVGGKVKTMADLNKVFLMGRLTFDPELRRTTGGTAVTELRLATTRSWSGRDGERREETLFIGVTVWDRQAENCCQFLRKGSAVHVEGSLKMDSWDDKNTGEKRSKILVHADRVQFLDGRRGDSAGGMGASPDDDYAAGPQTARDPAARRGGTAAPARGNAGTSESRAANGSGRPSYQAANLSENPVASAADDAEEDDIPF
jgi:single-strand DNA-binding protein